jgi:hypothetical protein
MKRLDEHPQKTWWSRPRAKWNSAGQMNQIFFTAGIGDEQHGLFGFIARSN